MTEPNTEISYASEDIERRYQQLRTLYGERDTDIYISGYSRSGTTMAHLLLYQLTTDGNMDFDHIFHVLPWLFYNALRGTEPPYPPEPRVIKTHDDYSFYPEGTKGRFIYVIRDGMDVIVSFYYHRMNAKGFSGTFEEHFNDFICGMDYNGRYYNWFEHVKGWVENRNNLSILVVRYESLLNDFDRTVENLGRFCNLPLTDSVLQRARERTSFAFMRRHQLKLGPAPTMFRNSEDAPFKVKNQTEFIRTGRIGEGGVMLTPEQKAIYYKKFQEVLGQFDFLSHYGKKT